MLRALGVASVWKVALEVQCVASAAKHVNGSDEASVSLPLWVALLQAGGSVGAVILGPPSLAFFTVMFISFLNILPVTKCIFDERPKFISALVFNLHV